MIANDEHIVHKIINHQNVYYVLSKANRVSVNRETPKIKTNFCSSHRFDDDRTGVCSKLSNNGESRPSALILNTRT